MSDMVSGQSLASAVLTAKMQDLGKSPEMKRAEASTIGAAADIIVAAADEAKASAAESTTASLLKLKSAHDDTLDGSPFKRFFEYQGAKLSGAPTPTP